MSDQQERRLGPESEGKAVALLKAVVETAVDGIVTINGSGTIITANRAVQRIFGYDPEELIGQNVKVLMPEPYHSEHDGYLGTYHRTGNRKIIGIGREVQGRRKDGTVFPIDLAVGETTTDDGPIFTGIIRDISERKSAAEELERERGMLKAVLDNAVDGIITIDERGFIVTANPSTTSIFGFTQKELIGKNVKMLMPSPYQEEHDSYLAAYLTTGVRKIIGIGREVQGRRKDGSVFPMELSVSETLTEDGRIFTGIVRDVTQRKRAEQDALDKQAAIRANEAKNEFLSRMSHELRTPLNAVLGFAQLLEMRYEDPNIIEATQAIIKGGNHLLMLINEVLDLARIESGTLTISSEAVEVTSVVEHAVDLVHPLANKAEVSIQPDYASFEGAVVQADRRRLLQVLINVVTNAIKYNRPGGSVLLRGETKGESARIIVEDTGFGIGSENISEIFQPFRRFGDPNIEGSGLGLAVSKSFVDLMNGTIALESSSEAGSVFSIELPTAVHPANGAQTGGPDAADGASQIDGHHTVLYIEDNPSNTRLIELAFQDWGDVTLLTCVNGRDGLNLATERRPDLVLLDLHLPDIAGYEVLNALQADPETADIPVVVISADAMTRQIRRLVQAGARDYVTKPIDLRRLNDIVRGILLGEG